VESQGQFVRSVLILCIVVIAVFVLEFIGEWYRLGRPGLEAMSWAGQNNPKLADILSPMARAYNNILAMLLATIALAIPLTANMYTPKLIEMFLSDRINQFMLFFWAIGAAHVLWVMYLVGPQFAPSWAIGLATAGALVGWIALIPYFFYIARFLDPSIILSRLKYGATSAIDDAVAGQIPPDAAHELLQERIHQIGTILLKTVDRGERGVTLEAIRALQSILQHYGERKKQMPAGWFKLKREQFIGMSRDAFLLLEEDRTWVEHRVLTQIYLGYQSALSKTQDVISSLSEATRQIAESIERGTDEKALELTIKFFNNYLREAIKRKDLHAIYDIVYQYRRLASGMWHRPGLLKKMGKWCRMYSEQAEAAGLAFVPQLVGIDLGWIVREAYEKQSPVADALLDEMMALRHTTGTDTRVLLVKAKAILGGWLAEHGLTAPADRLRRNLADVPAPILAAAASELLTLEDRTFWEVTDRQLMLEWVPPEHRPPIKTFLDSVQGA
jgi:hypothetical protein